MKKIFALFSLLSLSHSLFSQNAAFRKTYGQSSWLLYGTVLQTADGGFGVPVSTDTVVAGFTDYSFLRLDSTGNLLWQKTYGTGYYEATIEACKMSDGGFAISGVVLIANLYRMNILRLDSAGNLLWSKIISNCNGTPTSIRETSNGNLMIIAWAEGGIGQSDIVFIKMDSSGNILYSKAFGSNEAEVLWDVSYTDDGGVIVCGDSYVLCGSTGGASPFILKLDSSGNMNWHKILYLGSCIGGQGFSVTQTRDGDYLAGLSLPFGVGTTVVKFDSLGNLKWCNSYSAGIHELKDIAALSDGYIFTDLIGDTVNNFISTFFNKIDTSGNLIWSKRFVDPANQYRYGFDRFETTIDDNLITAGGYFPLSATKTNLFIQKMPLYSIDSICDTEDIISSVSPLTLNLDTGFVEVSFVGPVSNYFGTVVNTPAFSTSDLCIYTGIEKINIEPSIKVYPNPVEDKLKIQVDNFQHTSIEVEVIDVLGSIILRNTINRSNDLYEMNIGDLNTGVYFVKLSTGSAYYTKKILKL